MFEPDIKIIFYFNRPRVTNYGTKNMNVTECLTIFLCSKQILVLLQNPEIIFKNFTDKIIMQKHSDKNTGHNL